MFRRTLETRELVTCLRHDLRDPLGAMTHWLHLLERTPADPALQARACSGIRSAIAEQLKQIDRLGSVFEMAQVLPAPSTSRADQGRVLVSVVLLLEQALGGLGSAQRARVVCEDLGDWEIAVRPDAMVDAVSSLLAHGLRQLLEGERLCIRLRHDAHAQRVGLCLQTLEGPAGPIDQPWKLLAEPQPVSSLALLHARCVLSQHQAGLRIITLTTPDDTLEVDFPVGSRSEWNRT